MSRRWCAAVPEVASSVAVCVAGSEVRTEAHVSDQVGDLSDRLHFSLVYFFLRGFL